MNLANRAHLKLLFISADKFPPFRGDLSVLFGREIAGRGHAIDWILQSDKVLKRPYRTRWSGCTVLVGPTHMGTAVFSTIKRHLFGFLHDLNVFQMLRNSRYDFVIMKDKCLSGVMALTAARLHRVRFIYWLSYPYPEDSIFQAEIGTARFPVIYWIRGHVFRHLLYRVLIPLSHHTFVQTENMRENITQQGISKDKMTAVPMAVSLEHTPFFGHNTHYPVQDKERIVLYLGTLARVRHMDFLLRTHERVLKKQNNVRLYLVGSSENPLDEQFLRDEAKRLRIEHAVTMTGFLPQNEVWQHVKKADVCVSPIYPAPILNCGSPSKLLEYLAMGKAVVANDHPEQQQVISESKAGICVPYRESDFAEAILYLLTHPEVARRMGYRGREYIEAKRNYRHTADLVEAKFIELSNIRKYS